MSSRKGRCLKDETRAKKKESRFFDYLVEDLMKQPSSTQIGRKITDTAWLYW